MTEINGMGQTPALAKDPQRGNRNQDPKDEEQTVNFTSSLPLPCILTQISDILLFHQ